MEANAWKRYIEKTLRDPEFRDLSRSYLSVLLTGSTSLGLKDSDWDFKILCSGEGAKRFFEKHGTGFSHDDKRHNPEAFTLFKPLGFIDREFKESLPVGLWIYNKAIVLRDDENLFGKKLEKAQLRFLKLVPALVDHKYLRLRCTRHSLKAAQRRNDNVACRFLVSETSVKVMQLMHLLRGRPYPYNQWLPWSYKKLFSQEFAALSSQLEDSASDDLETAIRAAMASVETLVTIMIDKGYPERQLREWWHHI